MHIPDGLIPLWQCAIYYLIVIIVGYFAVQWSKKHLDERNIPLIAVLAAGIFVIQMINQAITPVLPGAGVSGHVMGAALVAIIIGSPFAGFLVMALILIIQALLFGDGGITALGANLFNMGVIGSFVGFYTYKGLKGIIKDVPAVFVGAWASLFIAAIVCAIELYFAGKLPLELGIPIMATYHFIIGILIEGLVTVIVFVGIKRIRPDIIGGAKYVPE